MKCPHCLKFFHNVEHSHMLGEGPWSVVWRTCPACEKIIIDLESTSSRSPRTRGARIANFGAIHCYPKVAARVEIPPDVPKSCCEDYTEALVTMTDSPRASAALSRHCLRILLSGCAATTPSTLGGEIEQVRSSKKLPPHLNEYLEAVPIIGNFATYPGKSTHPAELAPAEPGEPEWNLEVIEALFEHYFVQPELINRMRSDLINRLASVGKAPQATAARNPSPRE